MAFSRLNLSTAPLLLAQTVYADADREYQETSDEFEKSLLVPNLNELFKQKIFHESFHQDVDKLNIFIDQLNEAQDKAIQLSLLSNIYQQKQAIDNKYPHHYIVNYPSYRETMLVEWPDAFKTQCEKLGTKIPHDAMLHVGLIPAPSPLTTLSEIVANMTPDEISVIFQTLADGEEFNSSAFLTIVDELNTPNAEAFIQFFSQHTIDYLGGENTRNFKITAVDGSAFVLKANYGEQGPKDAEAYLRAHSLKDTLTPVHMERRGWYTFSGEAIASSLIISDYCTNGNVKEYNAGPHLVRHEEKIESSLLVFRQMAAILLNVQKDNIAFLDMKNSNWLVNDQGSLRIADTKSFVFASAEGLINFNTSENLWYTMQTTRHMDPPELDPQVPSSIDAMHTFMLGKNLYQCLSSCDDMDLLGRHDGDRYSFKAPIFSTTKGQQLQQLIKKMIKYDPSERITMSEALAELIQIQTPTKLSALTLQAVGLFKAPTVPLNPPLCVSSPTIDELTVVQHS